MTLDRSYIGYLGFLGIDLFKSVLVYSNGAICLIKLLFDLGLFTVYQPPPMENSYSTSVLMYSGRTKYNARTKYSAPAFNLCINNKKT